jgi:hypothetical protein
MTLLKDVGQLTEADIRVHPVWEFNTVREEMGETVMSPITNLPVKHLIGRLVGTEVVLACGVTWPALLGSLDLQDPAPNEHLLTITFMKGLERCHFGMDPCISVSAQSVAKFLGYSVEQIFPIHFDISEWCIGHTKSVRGSILQEASVRLPLQERISLVMKSSAMRLKG